MKNSYGMGRHYFIWGFNPISPSTVLSHIILRNDRRNVRGENIQFVIFVGSNNVK